MAVTLKKGQRINLSKSNPGLKTLVVGLGWNPNVFNPNAEFDLDASAFLLDANGKCRGAEDFIFYGNLKHSSECLSSSGDNRTGDGDGDDEQLFVDLSKVPSDIEKIAFCVTIYDAEARRQNFGQVSDAYIRIENSETHEELLRFDLGEDFSIETSVLTGELYKKDSEWRFSAVGDGSSGGLAAFCEYYGLEVED